jgi:hypothetical protein
VLTVYICMSLAGKSLGGWHFLTCAVDFKDTKMWTTLPRCPKCDEAKEMVSDNAYKLHEIFLYLTNLCTSIEVDILNILITIKQFLELSFV